MNVLQISWAFLVAGFIILVLQLDMVFGLAPFIVIAFFMLAKRRLRMRPRGWKRDALQDSIHVAIRSIYDPLPCTTLPLLNEFPQSGNYRGFCKGSVIYDKKTSEMVHGDGSKQLIFKKMVFDLSDDNVCRISGPGISEGLVNAAGLAYWVEDAPNGIQKLVVGQFHGNQFSGEYLTSDAFRGIYEISEQGEDLEIPMGIPTDNETSTTEITDKIETIEKK